MTKLFKLRVPASSANLGSGFDSIGACLDIWNEIKFCEGDFSISNKGYGAKSFSTDKTFALNGLFSPTNVATKGV